MSVNAAIKTGFVVSVVCGLMGCATDTTTSEARQLVARGALLVDLRSKPEYDEGHAKGAVNLSPSELEKKMSELPPTQQVVLYCHTGARSGVTTLLLRKKGYKNIHNVGSLSHVSVEHLQSTEGP